MKTKCFFLLFASLYVSQLYAVERHVPSQYPTIQAAIDAAKNGDEILVAPGTYYGTGNYNIMAQVEQGSLTIRATSYAGDTFIDCKGSASKPCGGITLINCHLEGFSITGAYDITMKSWPAAVILMESSSIKNCAIYGNQGLLGAIYCMGSDTTKQVIEKCIIAYNSCSQVTGGGLGGAILCQFGQPTIVNCVITENVAVYGGGIGCFASQPKIINCTITNNEAHYGGGIGCVAPSLNVGLANKSSHPTIANCIIYGNEATVNGGQISLDFPYPSGSEDAASGITILTTNLEDTLTGIDLGQKSYVVDLGGNIDSEPLFHLEATNAITIELSPDSPCINKGYNAVISELTNDCVGNSRVSGTVVDLGATEYQFEIVPEPEVLPPAFSVTSVQISSNMIMLRGRILADDVVGKTIVVQVGDFTGEIDTTGTGFMNLGRMGLYRGSSGISLGLFNFSDKTFMLMAQGANLGTLDCPMAIDISLSE